MLTKPLWKGGKVGVVTLVVLLLNFFLVLNWISNRIASKGFLNFRDEFGVLPAVEETQRYRVIIRLVQKLCFQLRFFVIVGLPISLHDVSLLANKNSLFWKHSPRERSRVMAGFTFVEIKI
jgi:hypothetical protein